MAVGPIGHAMWGGRRPEDVGEPRTIYAVDPEAEPESEAPEPEPQAQIMALRSLLSLCLVIFGMILLSVGMGLILGVGGALAGAGLVALVIGTMLGMGDET